MPVITRIFLFLYSTPNIVGMLLGLPGLLLYALGVIQVLGIVIVIGLYFTGLLMTPRQKPTDFSIHPLASADEIQMKWEAIVQEIGRRGSTEMHIKVKSIKVSVFEMLSLLTDDTLDKRSLVAVRHVVLVYLPDALQAYFSLPPALAHHHPVRNGKSAYRLLNEQLDLIEREMRKISVLAHTQDKWQLTTQSMFLMRTFDQQRFLGEFLGTTMPTTAVKPPS